MPLVKDDVPAPLAGRPVDRRLLEATALERTGILSMLSHAGEPSKEFLDLLELGSGNSSDLRFEYLERWRFAILSSLSNCSRKSCSSARSSEVKRVCGRAVSGSARGF